MWGDGKCDILEKLQLRLCEYILAVNKSTCSNMMYGKLGITHLDIDIKDRMIVYWAKLVNEDQSKISHMIYFLLYKLDEFNIFKLNWLSSIRYTLNDSGFPGIWLAQSLPCSVSTFRNILKLRLKDQFIQKWHESISESGKCLNYRIFKNHFKLEKYLVDLPDNLRKMLTKFRCRNHRLPIERGCHENNPLDMRLCHYCPEDIGDEYPYLLIYSHFKNERKKYVESKFWKRLSTLMLKKLMNDNNIQNISLFIKCILSKFK